MKAYLNDNGNITVEFNGDSREFASVSTGDRVYTIDTPMVGKIATGGKNWPCRVTVWDNGRYTLSGGLNGKPIRSIVGWNDGATNVSRHNGR